MRQLPIAVFLALLAAAPFALIPSGVEAQEAGNKARGLDLALRVCANCHAVAAGETVSPVSAAPSFEDIADTPGMTAMALSAFLSTPHRTMPNLILTPDEIGDVSAHILSLKDGG